MLHTIASPGSSQQFGDAYLMAITLCNLAQAIWFGANFLLYCGCATMRRRMRQNRTTLALARGTYQFTTLHSAGPGGRDGGGGGGGAGGAVTTRLYESTSATVAPRAAGPTFGCRRPEVAGSETGIRPDLIVSIGGVPASSECHVTVGRKRTENDCKARFC